MILAITLSMAVLFGWQLFVVGPALEKEAAMPQAVAGVCGASDFMISMAGLTATCEVVTANDGVFDWKAFCSGRYQPYYDSWRAAASFSGGHVSQS